MQSKVVNGVSFGAMLEVDVPEVLNLQNELGFMTWSKAQILSSLKSSGAVALVAKLEGVLGYAMFQLLADESELLAIAVSKAFARKGVATELFKMGVEELKLAGAKRLFLEVREGNAPARNFYCSMGAGECGFRKNYYGDGESAVLYRLDF